MLLKQTNLPVSGERQRKINTLREKLASGFMYTSLIHMAILAFCYDHRLIVITLRLVVIQVLIFILYFGIIQAVGVFLFKRIPPDIQLDKDGIPNIHADKDGFVTCPYCHGTHRHGGQGNGIASGHRVPDCGNKVGYIVVPYSDAKK
jgi:hypothetical protein